MKKSVMSVKAMIDMYVEYGLDESTWDMLRNMSYHGLISNENWHEFFETCRGWTFDEEVNGIVDSETETVIYLYDGNGNLHKM